MASCLDDISCRRFALGLADTLAGGAGGAVIGLAVSVLVNVSLIEISTNPFFAFIFGILLLFLGGLIFGRVYAAGPNNKDNRGLSGYDDDSVWGGRHHPQRPPVSYSRLLVMTFSILVMVAGVCCFILEKDWFKEVSPNTKVPMYSLLGVALWFALSFTIMDVVNFCGATMVSGYRGLRGRGHSPSAGRAGVRPFISTSTQICLVLVCAVLLGLYFGSVFGTLDVEDYIGNGSAPSGGGDAHIGNAEGQKSNGPNSVSTQGLSKVSAPTNTSGGSNRAYTDYTYTLPVGVAVCAAVGAINQAFLRPDRVSEVYEPVYNDGI